MPTKENKVIINTWEISRRITLYCQKKEASSGVVPGELTSPTKFLNRSSGSVTLFKYFHSYFNLRKSQLVINIVLQILFKQII